jgi:hypothetical protein
MLRLKAHAEKVEHDEPWGHAAAFAKKSGTPVFP